MYLNVTYQVIRKGYLQFSSSMTGEPILHHRPNFKSALELKTKYSTSLKLWISSTIHIGKYKTYTLQIKKKTWSLI